MSRDKHEAFKVRHRQSEQPRRPMCETLEDRLLFIAYTVTGTNGNDSISISISGNSIISVVNGVSDSGSDIINNEIEINGLGGNDIISIIETGANTVTVNAGTGNDTINAGNGGNNLDAIDDFITVNGEGNTDSLVLFDQNSPATSDGNYRVTGGNQYGRTFVPFITGNVESVTFHCTTAASKFVLVDDVPTANVTINGNAAQSQLVTLRGASPNTISSGIYTPSGTTPDSGVVTTGAATISFVQCDIVSFEDVPAVTMVTPNAADQLLISAGVTVSGNSGGVTFANLGFTGATTLTLDLATNDAGGGNDTITGSAAHGGAATLRVNPGTGTNTLTATGGNWNIQALGSGLDVVSTGATTNVNFAGSQSIRRLEVNNSGDASLTGTIAILNIQQLAIATGDGGISVASGNITNVTNSFAIAASRFLTKGGGGTLNITAAQSHGAGSGFINNNGTTNFNTNCGSTTARPLDLFSNQGLINLNSTQHVDSLGTNFGNIVVGANGNRMVVTNSFSIGGEGGTFNLNDNDMVVDYSGASQYSAIRQHIVNGFNAGNWNGLGIGSGSAAAAAASPNKTGLGYAEATQIFNSFPASFVGQQVDNTSILIRYTLLGNSDLNNTTDISDFAFLASNFNTPGDWRDGDYTYDSLINISDFSLQASNFNKVFAGDLPRMLSSGTRAAGSPFAQQRLIELMTDDGPSEA